METDQGRLKNLGGKLYKDNKRKLLRELSGNRHLCLLGIWSGREDLNLRPPAPHAGALPGCATPRLVSTFFAIAALKSGVFYSSLL